MVQIHCNLSACLVGRIQDGYLGVDILDRRDCFVDYHRSSLMGWAMVTMDVAHAFVDRVVVAVLFSFFGLHDCNCLVGQLRCRLDESVRYLAMANVLVADDFALTCFAIALAERCFRFLAIYMGMVGSPIHLAIDHIVDTLVRYSLDVCC